MLVVLLTGLCALAVIYAFNAGVSERPGLDGEFGERDLQEEGVSLSRDIGQPADQADEAKTPLSPDVTLAESADLAQVLAIVMDDCGGNMELAKRVLSLDLPITWAIIPNLRFSSETASLLSESGVPFLIHVPMQAISDPDGKAGDPRQYYIGTGMNDVAVRNALSPLLDSLPGAYGVNNHRGSKATEDRELMDSVMSVLLERGLFFMDSNTSKRTVAYEAALDMGLAAAKNSRFLDNESDRAKISEQIDKAVSSVKKGKKSRRVAICHLRPETVAALETLSLDDIAKKGVQLVTLPQLMELEELSDE
ncbi:MAG: divergent polysaccharide deacetylase family protein [Synergistaceae bacterium]|nr:divergent polysaccharide deacetylase family protein [Synergistaceae bacterium]